MANANTQFGGFLTNVGVVKQTNANALQIPWKITRMQLGDAGGEPAQFPDPTPSPTQTALINVVHDAPLNALYPSPTDPGVLIAELVLPPNVGGWWIRETALRDEDGDLIAVAKPAPSYKPLLVQNTGRTQTIRMHIVVGNTANIALKIDPSVVLATRAVVEAGDAEARAYAQQLVEDAATEATQEEAEEGANGTRKMTPRRVFQALRSPLASLITRPIGSHYVQFAESDGSFSAAKSPSTLFGGTWTLKFNTESVFFRTEGTLAAAGRSSGVQGDAIRNITGSLNDMFAGSLRSGTGAFANFWQQTPAAGALSSAGDPGAAWGRNGEFDASLVVPTAEENRVKNRLIRVWERTA